jgi:hypothetical protein
MIITGMKAVLAPPETAIASTTSARAIAKIREVITFFFILVSFLFTILVFSRFVILLTGSLFL